MPRDPKRILRERRTIQSMIRIYCRNRHRQSGPLCAKCREIADYAMHRLDQCPFQKAKPTCLKCPIHCYQPAMRERVREIMRQAGPKMLWHHPILALYHLFDGFRQPPQRKKTSPTSPSA